MISSRNYRLKLWEKGARRVGIPAQASRFAVIRTAISLLRFRWSGRRSMSFLFSTPPHRYTMKLNDDADFFLFFPRLVDATLAVAILSAILMLARFIMGFSGQFSPIFSLLYDGLLAFFWFHSLSSQASPVFLDMQHPSPLPW
ncbi:hypothetical protein CCHR01_03646 [Colletotrichum chrysophilum]|uniref:Uncharacterized protein n=1 Tax=Colletotrichum chrysophilum TaxID=1836956 RepID=A0AAD9ATI9_9PEZI|nr:hypothetical protein CCHR01_03646 [Colletotrichum chrysophilum]